MALLWTDGISENFEVVKANTSKKKKASQSLFFPTFLSASLYPFFFFFPPFPCPSFSFSLLSCKSLDCLRVNKIAPELLLALIMHWSYFNCKSCFNRESLPHQWGSDVGSQRCPDQRGPVFRELWPPSSHWPGEAEAAGSRVPSPEPSALSSVPFPFLRTPVGGFLSPKDKGSSDALPCFRAQTINPLGLPFIIIFFFLSCSLCLWLGRSVIFYLFEALSRFSILPELDT